MSPLTMRVLPARAGIWLLSFGLLLGVLPRAAADEARSWQDLKAAGDRTMAEAGYPIAGHYWRAAEQFYLGALELAEQEDGGPAVVADLLLSLSRPYRYLGRYREAVETLEKALDLAERAHGPEAAALCEILDALGNLYFALERPDDSERVFTRCLGIRERAFGPESLEAAESLMLLGVVRRERGAAEEGLALYRRALAIREAHLPPDHDLVDEALAGVTTTLRMLGREKEAERLRERYRTATP